MPISKQSLSSKNASKPSVALFDLKLRTPGSVAAYPVFEIHYDGTFIRLPNLSYAFGRTLSLRFSNSTRMNFKQMLDLLAYKLECEIRALYFCRPRFVLSTGLTIVECDNDVKRMYELAEEYGLIGLYVSHKPVNLACFYYPNLTFNLLDKETHAKLAIHDKLVQLATSKSYSDILAWEEEEGRSPPLRTPPSQPRRKGIEFQGKNLFMDFLHSESVDDAIEFSDDEWYYGGFVGFVAMDVGWSTSPPYNWVQRVIEYDDATLKNVPTNSLPNQVLLDAGSSSVPRQVGSCVKPRYGHKVSRKPYARRLCFETPRTGLRKIKMLRHLKALTRDRRRGCSGLKPTWYLRNGRLECRYCYAAC